MNSSAVTTGIILVLVAGVLQGTFALFLKKTEPWKWENFWAIFSLGALAIFPLGLAILFVPQLGAVLSSLSIRTYLSLLAFGAIWGIGNVLFGLAVVRIGIALTYSIVISMTGVLGTMIPLLHDLPPNQMLLGLVAGLSLMVAGIIISGYAGVLRARGEKRETNHINAFLPGLAMAVASGFASPMLNVGFVAGKPVSDTALGFGASAMAATLPIWLLVLFGGFLVNIGYAIYLLRKNNTFRLFSLSTQPGFSAVAAALFWFGGFAIFGVATVKLGSLGSSIGWALLMGTMIIVSGLWGVATGEWKGAAKSLRIQWVSVLTVLAGVTLVASTLF